MGDVHAGLRKEHSRHGSWSRGVPRAWVLALLAVVTAGCGAGKEPDETVSGLREASTTVTPGANVNVSRQATSQVESAIAIDPSNPSRLFTFANEVDQPLTGGMFAAFSSDGGSTWHSSAGPGDTSSADFRIADGNDGLPSACCDPTATFDSFGNLFVSYIDATGTELPMAISTDGGATFTELPALATGIVDQPTLRAGPGSNGAPQSLWGTAFVDGSIHASGAAITGPGAGNVGALSDETVVSGNFNFGDIAIGPAGQVVITYQDNAGSQNDSTIYVNTDPDGLGAATFGAQVAASATDVGGFDFIAPQADRSVDAEAGLAYDLSSGPHRGRLYLVYTDETPDESDDTDIWVRFSDDDGASFSAAVRVNDDTTTNSQFLPRIASDPGTGLVAVSFYDARNDAGSGGPGDTNGIPNDDAQLFAAVSSDSGLSFGPNVRVSTGTSNQAAADPTAFDIDLGDFTGLAFAGGNLYPTWSDNSNSTADNPDGSLSKFDIYVAKVAVNQDPVAKCKNPLVAANGSCQASVVAADVNDGSFDPDPGESVNCTIDSGGPFGLGPHNVRLTCTDPHGASNFCTAVVTVVDTTPPTITCPSSVNVPCVNASGATATFSTTQSDNCGAGAATCTRPSGSTFPLGSTTDTCTVLDTSGNSASCSFNVTVALGDNPVCCPAGTHVILGTSNNDSLTGTSGSDCILGRGAQDVINGGGGNDFISGGDGDDTINGGDGNDTIFGGTGQDHLNGNAGNDTISGGDGDDTCHGNDGNDTVLGGQGQDQLFGDNNDDVLIGETGDDHLEGGDGNDLLIGSGLHDTCIGGPGTDTFQTCQSQTQ